MKRSLWRRLQATPAPAPKVSIDIDNAQRQVRLSLVKAREIIVARMTPAEARDVADGLRGAADALESPAPTGETPR